MLALGAAPAAPLERLAACLDCHGAAGSSERAGVPSLGGQPAAYLAIQLYLFREGLRPGSVMGAAVRGLGDAQLQEVAQRLAALPAPRGATAEDRPRLQSARALVERHRCAYCHGADLAGHDGIPRLAGQREEVILQALRDYKSNVRPGYDASMAEVVQAIDETAMRELAYLLARTQ